MIPNRPAPRLHNEGRWSKDFVDFVGKCLEKDPKHRPSADMLLTHPFVSEVVKQLQSKTANFQLMKDMIARLRKYQKQGKQQSEPQPANSRASNRSAISTPLVPQRPVSPLKKIASPPFAQTVLADESDSTGTMVIKTESSIRPISPQASQNAEGGRLSMSSVRGNISVPNLANTRLGASMPILPGSRNHSTVSQNELLEKITLEVFPMLSTPLNRYSPDYEKRQQKVKDITNQFKDDLRLLISGYEREIKGIYGETNVYAWCCLFQQTEVLFIFRSDLEKMHNHIQVIHLFLFGIDRLD